ALPGLVWSGLLLLATCGCGRRRRARGVDCGPGLCPLDDSGGRGFRAGLRLRGLLLAPAIPVAISPRLTISVFTLWPRAAVVVAHAIVILVLFEEVRHVKERIALQA